MSAVASRTLSRRPIQRATLSSLDAVSSSTAAAAATTTTDGKRSGLNYIVLHQKNHHRRYKSSSSAFADFLPNITESVRQRVKSTLLNEAVREDSRFWRHSSSQTLDDDHPHHNRVAAAPPPPVVNGHHPNHSNQHNLNQYQRQQQQQQEANKQYQHHNNHDTDLVGSVDEAIGSSSSSSSSSSLYEDPLDDLNLQEPARYWPHLPPHVFLIQSNTNDTTTTTTTTASITTDPFQLAKLELDSLSKSIRQDLIGTDHPVLNQAAAYFFDPSACPDGGKKIRPMMVLLLSRALAEHSMMMMEQQQQEEEDLVVNSNNQSSPASAAVRDVQNGVGGDLFTAPLPWQRADLPRAQRRLGEISEMIHTASLFHDDVIDGSDTRRGVPAVHMVFGNKTAILAGDYLLARASICLARLRNVHVVETMSTIIEHLVRGEVMQMRGTIPFVQGRDGSSSSSCTDRIQYYLRKNFYKTASLMANSCKSAALLGHYPPELVRASYRYGKHVGMAFQLVDDVLDLEGSLSQLGKPSLADLRAGLATAPVLFAAEEFEELNPLIDRKFKREGDVDRAVELVFASSGLERTKQLARVHAETAMDAILELNPSDHRDSLVILANKVVARTK